MTALTKDDLIYCDDAPSDLAPGWYPGIRCWDQNEGGFPVGLYWDGKAWEPGALNFIPQLFEDEASAEARADELNLGW